MMLREIVSPADLEVAFPVIKELRPHLDFAGYISLYESAKVRDDYKLVSFFEENRCLAVMGYRILFDFVHGKHLYIDDLVVTSSLRSKGIGKQFLDYAEDEARKLQCQGLRLCTGVENEAGKRFYERHGWNPRALAYKKKLVNS